MTWRFLNTGFSDGLFNMGFDEGLARELQDHGNTGTVRVYGWSPPAISLGWNQSIRDIDEGKALSSGIDVVRRPTGGRAILHSEEITYSAVMVTKVRNVLQVYNRISLALVEGIRSLGINASLEKSQPYLPSLYKDVSSAVCFSSSARHEIKVNGRKLAGSAQRRLAREDGSEVVLQHGSLLLGPDHLRIAEFLRLPEGMTAELVRADLEERTIDLRSACGVDIAFEDVAEALRGGFERAWEMTFDLSLSSYERTVNA